MERTVSPYECNISFFMWLHARFFDDFLKLRVIAFVQSFTLHRLSRRPSGVITATLLHFSTQSLETTVCPCECNSSFVCGCMQDFLTIFWKYAVLPLFSRSHYIDWIGLHTFYWPLSPFFSSFLRRSLCPIPSRSPSRVISLHLPCQGRSQKFVSQGDKTGGLGTEVPQRVQRQSPGGVWGLSPQKLRTYMLITIAIMC